MRCHRWLSHTAYWLILLVHAGLIFWSSSLSSGEIPGFLGKIWDKFLHGAAFGLLSFLFLLAANRGFRHPVKPWSLAAAFLFTLLYGLVDEWHQSMVATRVSSANDLLADGLGGLLALPVYLGLSRRRCSRGQS